MGDHSGAWALWDEKTYREWVLGRGAAPDGFDPASAGARLAKASLLAWTGPSTHILVAAEDGSVMEPETAREAVDFASGASSPRLSFEIVAPDLGSAWPTVWLAVEYVQRRAEWSKRPARLTVRCEQIPSPSQAGYLESRGVDLRLALSADAPPKRLPSRQAARVILSVGRGAADPGGWVRELAAAGVRSVLLEPPEPLTIRGLAAFMQFWRDALEAMLALPEGGLREERAAALLGGRRWEIPGLDIIAELAYAPDGRILSSERAALAGGRVAKSLCVGEVGVSRFADLRKNSAVLACLSQALAETQPLCQQCVYGPRCAVGASRHLQQQGTPWGQTPSSLGCSLHMAILDLLFERLGGAHPAGLESWGEPA